ncbi:MAG: tetratricopeptide repeat-containing sensor histidine kinase [Bacteroidales bacterium]|nr:tetratricopeptide repeat-containing sensor histidine kinase [Bacteroidales bacterium]
MRYFKLLSVLILCHFSGLAQEPKDIPDLDKKIGNIENILFNALDHGLSDRDKVTLCDSLAHLYSLNENYEKSIEHAVRALRLAEEKGFTDFRIRMLRLLGNSYFRLDKYETAIDHYEKLLEIFINHKNNQEIAGAYIDISRSYFQWSKYEVSREYSGLALKISEEAGYQEGVALAHKQLGAIMIIWGEYDEALRYYQFPLMYWENSGDKIRLARMYNAMGMLYEELSDLSKAREFYSKAITLFDQVGDTWDLVNMTLHLGDIFLKEGNYKKALETYFTAERKGIGLNNKKLNAITLSNIGEAYNLMGNYQRALDYQQKSLIIKEDIGDKKRLVISYNELGKIYSNMGDYNNALKYLLKGLEAGHEVNLKSQLKHSCKLLSDVYDSIGNYRLSLKYHRLFSDLKDSLYSAESNRMITEMRTKYESEKKEKENERLRTAELINKNKIRNQKWIIALIFISLFFALLQAYVFYAKNKSIRRINEVLSQQNRLIENQKADLEKLNGKLTEANAAKDKFFSIVAHDLKNPFTSLLGFADLLVSEYDVIPEADKKMYLEQLKQSADSTLSLLHNLLEWARTQSGQVTLHAETINLNEVAQDAKNLISSGAMRKKIDLQFMIPENMQVVADRNMLLAVFLNLLSNAVKFTREGGFVKVSASGQDEYIQVEVADNGTGMPGEVLDKLFSIGTKIQSKGTANEPGTGLGLILCKEFIEKNGGKIRVESAEEKGSRFFFTLPVAKPAP